MLFSAGFFFFLVMTHKIIPASDLGSVPTHDSTFMRREKTTEGLVMFPQPRHESLCMPPVPCCEGAPGEPRGSFHSFGSSKRPVGEGNMCIHHAVLIRAAHPFYHLFKRHLHPRIPSFFLTHQPFLVPISRPPACPPSCLPSTAQLKCQNSSTFHFGRPLY